MKKTGKKETKPKDFSNAPFKGLKSFTADAATPAKVDGAKPIQPSEPADDADEREIFLRHVEGVRKLNRETPEKRPAKVARENIARAREEEEQRIFLASLSGMDVTFRDEFPDVQPLRPLAANRLRQLKSGTIRIDLELDLHGLNRDEALASLGRFVSGAYNRGQKAILIITGKGNNSPAEPVLQGAVASWLREAGKKMVAEFCPAPRQMGGSGAFVVFLKEKKT
jgi:DNA-nicking Smr family endonuclease